MIFQRSTQFWGGLGLAWLVGCFLEGFSHGITQWHWHFSRVLVLALFAGLAWQRTEGRKILPSLIAALALTGQNLFTVNEPGMFTGDQWFFGGIVLLIAFLTTEDFWGMGLALAGATLLDLGISIFLFDGVVRHYDLPDPFFWNLSVTFLLCVWGVRTWREFRHARRNPPEDELKST